MKKVLYMIIFICIIYSCSAKKGHENAAHHYVNIELPAESFFSFRDYFDSIDIIPLELTKNSVLKKCDKTLLFKNYIFIFDRSNTGIYVFDKSGKFLYNSIKMFGNGRGEYGCITDFNIDSKTGDILILDASALKIKIYDTYFNYKYEVKLPSDLLPLGYFQKVTDDIILFHDGSIRNKHCINIFSIKKNAIISKVGYVGEEKTKQLPIVHQYPFSVTENNVVFTNTFPDNNLYHFDKLNFECYIRYSIGGKEFNPDNLRSGEPASYYKNIITNDNKAFIVSLKECAAYVSAFIYYDQRMYINFFDKEKLTNITIPNRFTDGKFVILPPALIDDDCIYTFAHPTSINMQIDKKYLSNKSRALVEDIKTDDNELIVKYYKKQKL